MMRSMKAVGMMMLTLAFVVGALAGGCAVKAFGDDEGYKKKSSAWSFGCYGSGGDDGVPIAPVDTTTYLFVRNPSRFTSDGVHDHGMYDYWKNKADRIIDLNADSCDFAFTILDGTLQNGTYADMWTSNNNIARLFASGGTGYGAWEIGRSDTRLMMYHLAVEDYFGSNTQILSSELFMKLGFMTETFTANDTIVHTLITEQGLDRWYGSKGIMFGSSPMPLVSHATWDYQVSGLDTQGYPAIGNQVAWPINFDDIYNYYELGDYSDWNTHHTYPTQAADSDMRFNLINTTQAIVNGAVNNGWVMTYKDDVSGAINMDFVHFDCTQGATGYGMKEAFFVIRGISKRYVAPFPNGADCALILSTDDGRKAFNDSVAAIWDRNGGTYSMYMAEKHVSSDNVSTYSPSGLKAFYDAWPHEMGPHSRYHDADNGLVYWLADAYDESHPGITSAMTDTATAAYDSLKFDADPEWMYDYLVEQGADLLTLSNSGMFCKTLALPQNQWSPEVLLAATDIGYKGMRTGMIAKNTVNTHYIWGNVANVRPGDTDTIYCGQVEERLLDPVNIVGVPMTRSVKDIVGDKTDDPDSATVYARAEWVFNQHRGNGTRVVHFLEHDFKTGGYTDGMNADHLRALAACAVDNNVWMCSVAEYVDWINLYSIATPTPEYNDIPDTFMYSVNDDAWAIPDGRYDALVPGIRDTNLAVATIEHEMPIYGSYIRAFPGTFSAAQYDSLAALDVVIFPWQYMDESKFAAMVDSVRARNPGFIALNYIWAFGARTTWDGDGNVTGDIFEITDGFSSPGGWGLFDDASLVRHGPNTEAVIFNYSNLDLADSLAVYYIDRLEEQGNLKDSVGFFIDWFYTPYPEWSVHGDSLTYVDLDQDASTWYADNEEAYNQEWIKYLTKALRREAATAGAQNFLIVANGTAFQDTLYSPFFDGGMFEDFHTESPEGEASMLRAVVNVPARMNRDRVDPALLFWHAAHDSSRHVSEAIASIGLGVTSFTNANEWFTIPPRFLDLGTRIDSTLVQLGDVIDCDFINSSGTITSVRSIEETDTALPWGYLIIDDAFIVWSTGGW
jgi:hypothetical protein